jgi:hypothetical protein
LRIKYVKHLSDGTNESITLMLFRFSLETSVAIEDEEIKMRLGYLPGALEF